MTLVHMIATATTECLYNNTIICDEAKPRHVKQAKHFSFTMKNYVCDYYIRLKLRVQGGMYMASQPGVYNIYIYIYTYSIRN